MLGIIYMISYIWQGYILLMPLVLLIFYQTFMGSGRKCYYNWSGERLTEKLKPKSEKACQRTPPLIPQGLRSAPTVYPEVTWHNEAQHWGPCCPARRGVIGEHKYVKAIKCSRYCYRRGGGRGLSQRHLLAEVISKTERNWGSGLRGGGLRPRKQSDRKHKDLKQPHGAGQKQEGQWAVCSSHTMIHSFKEFGLYP